MRANDHGMSGSASLSLWNRARNRAGSFVVPAILALIGFQLAHLATGLEGAAAGARIAFCALCVAGIGVYSVREFALGAVALALAGVLFASPGAMPSLARGLDLAAFFASFIMLLTLMKEAAQTSAAIAQVGHWLTSQPPGRRYYGTAIGGHALGVFLNFGAVSLMAPLIQGSAVHADGSPDPALERRQLAALLRGFSWMIIWAPTALTQAVMQSIFPELDWLELAALGLATSALMIGLGRALDRFEWRGDRAQAAVEATRAPRSAIFALLLVCGILISATLALCVAAGFTVSQALMFVAPAVTLGWFVGQDDTARSAAAAARRVGAFAPVVRAAAPSLARVAIALGLSALIGRLAAEVLPMERMAAHFDPSAVSGWLFLASLPVLIVLGGQVALSPILLVVLLGEAMGRLPELPAEQTHVAFALCVGWALSMSASPNATATLMVSAASGVPPTTLTWRWNGRYALLCYFCLVPIFALLSA